MLHSRSLRARRHPLRVPPLIRTSAVALRPREEMRQRLRALSMPLIAGALVAGFLVPLASPAPVSAQASGLHGRVLSGATPLQGFEVTLYATTPGGGPDALA